MMNALANHHILPHSGHGITEESAAAALTQSLNFSPAVATSFASVAATANPDKSAHSFDLDHLNKHGVIEHDVSLSRNDFLLGDNHSYNKEIWEEVVKKFGTETETSFESVSKARYERLLAVKKAHEEAGKDFQYGIKEFVFGYGECALFLGSLGDPNEGKIPVEYLRVLFGEWSQVMRKEGEEC
jgi:hypothetical protein